MRNGSSCIWFCRNTAQKKITQKKGADERDLEGDGEVAKALSEHPDNGVAEPGDDGDTGDLGVDRARLATLSLSCLGPRLAQGEDDVKEPQHAKEPPNPLDVAHGERAECAARDHEDCARNEMVHTRKDARKTWSDPGKSCARFYYICREFCLTETGKADLLDMHSETYSFTRRNAVSIRTCREKEPGKGEGMGEGREGEGAHCRKGKEP